MTTGIRNMKKPGTGWKYDEVGFTYDQERDPKSGQAVKYNSLGTEVVITNLAKSSLQ